MQPVLRLYSGSIWAVFREHLGGSQAVDSSRQAVFRQYVSSIQAGLRQYSGNIQEVLRLYTDSIQTVFRQY